MKLSASIAMAIVALALRGEPSEPRAKIELFNGRDLAGFSTWLVDSKFADPRGVFTVTNGSLRISGDGLGYLATTNAFRNYRLVTEYRWGTRNWHWADRVGKARDSGVFLHAIGPDGNSEDGKGAFMAALECNIFQGAVGDILLIRGHDSSGVLIAPRLSAETARKRDNDNWPTWQAGGQSVTLQRWGRLNWFGKDPNWKDTEDFRGHNAIEKLGWNRLECLCSGSTIEIRLNGVLVNRATSVWPSEGKILLQCEGSELFFRKLDLFPLQ